MRSARGATRRSSRPSSGVRSTTSAKAARARRTSRRAVEDSLKRLGTDRIDLYQLHFPDAATPFEETLEALDKLVRDGKVLEIGGSNFSAEQIDETDADQRRTRKQARFVSVQNEYSLLRRGPERFGVLDACARNGLVFIPYFPLASGVLTGKYHRDEAPPAGHPARRHAGGACRQRVVAQGLRPRRSARRLGARSRPHLARARDRRGSSPGRRSRA